MNERNRKRWRAVLTARDWKTLFLMAGPVRATRGVLTIVALGIVQLLGLRDAARRWAYRITFTDGRARRIAADHVLADLRDFTFARTSAFDKDPIIMARREGRRDVWLRISNYLNLDEAQVQTLMEIDDGY